MFVICSIQHGLVCDMKSRESLFILRHEVSSSIGGESPIWVGYHNLGQLLAPKRIELENPATSQIEDSSKAFPTVI